MTPLVRAAITMLAVTGARPARAQPTFTCPIGPDRVDATVGVSVTHDPASGIYAYAYTLKSAPSSAQEIESFELVAADPVAIQAPPGWNGLMTYDQRTVLWMAFELDPAIADVVTNDASVPPSIANIKPGKSLAGFSLRSLSPPGPVTYTVKGYAPVPFEPTTDEPDEEWEEYSVWILDNCTSSLTGRTGTTTGPVARRAPRRGDGR